MKHARLSKSKIVLGIQCEKALYLAIHHSKLASPTSESQQAIFDQGHEVGIFAQKLFPGGTIIDAPHADQRLAIQQTLKAIASGAPHIYEATFESDGVLVKVDILSRSDTKNFWDIVEVKSSTQVKEVHIQDVATQLWVVRNAGINVKSTSILHINNQCIFPDLSNLFSRVDVTDEAELLQDQLPVSVATLNKMLAMKTAPNREIGPHCGDPYDCAFKSHCWAAQKVPEISIFNIPRLSADKKWQYFAKGNLELDSIDASKLNPAQRRMVDYTISKKRYINNKGIKNELNGWEYPYAFLDFETIAYAIPRYPETRPYQQIPFQFSCHIQKNKNPNLDHHEYLHTENSDPRESIARALIASLPERGSVIAYNMAFEKQVLITLANQFPKYSKSLRDFASRLVDPLPIFRAHIYDPKFCGSFSIKEVAPAILGDTASYEGLNVGNGPQAQAAFLKLIYTETSALSKQSIRKGLLEYCKRDTQCMAELVGWLIDQASDA